MSLLDYWERRDCRRAGATVLRRKGKSGMYMLSLLPHVVLLLSNYGCLASELILKEAAMLQEALSVSLCNFKAVKHYKSLCSYSMV